MEERDVEGGRSKKRFCWVFLKSFFVCVGWESEVVFGFFFSRVKTEIVGFCCGEIFFFFFGVVNMGFEQVTVEVGSCGVEVGRPGDNADDDGVDGGDDKGVG